MFRIGDFSKMSKVTIKALRYYEMKDLIKPIYVDKFNGYRYYDSSQLVEVSRIISLKQIGLSIYEIKKVLIDNESLNELLLKKKKELEKSINEYNNQLSKINYILKEKNMKEEIFEKIVPSCYMYYKEGVLNDYSECGEFIYNSGNECIQLNPNIKCTEPDYCFMEYLDGGYKKNNIKVRYSQAVIKEDNPFKEDEFIKFREMPETKCICIYHKGSYNEIGLSYGKVLKYIEDNSYEIIGYPRECYIDGIWNKEKEDDYLTEIQVPIK